MTDVAARIAENLSRVRGRMVEAAARAGRAAQDVRLVAVTKSVSVDVIRCLVEAGCLELGESRPQQLWTRAAALADLPIRWHMIGHLQRNKVRRTAALAAMIHSLDSPRLAAAVDEEWGKAESAAGGGEKKPLPILLEVNVSGEAAKHGFQPETVAPFLPQLAAYSHLKPCGLMCMAALDGGPAIARRDFAVLRQLRDRLAKNCPPGVVLDELSMGMSGDFEEAIEEGATIVRVGSALFEGIDSNP